jgi:hypothetical protein
VEVSGIRTHQKEEFDPCSLSLPESDDEGSCIANVDIGSKEHTVEIQTFQKGIDPRNVSLLKSDYEVSRVGNVVDSEGLSHLSLLPPQEEVEIDGKECPKVRRKFRHVSRLLNLLRSQQMRSQDSRPVRP